MKKSVIFYIHLAFWVVIILSNFTRPILTRYLSPIEVAQISPYLRLLAPLYFYAGYASILYIKRTKRTLIISVSLVLVSYLVLFLISQKAFAYGLIPLSSVLLWLIIGGLFRIFIDWFNKRSDIILLEKENSESKLAALRSQINPHFLFNTLNNIDALIFQDQQKASQSLVKLSEIMRYMLKTSDDKEVSMAIEMDYIQNYISLEKLRLLNDGFLAFDVTGDYKNIKIAPMLFIAFIENAFKHSVSSDTEKGITIQFTFTEKLIHFTCLNHYDPTDLNKDNTNGIGLETVKNRLKLLYPNQYQLNINRENSIFKVDLQIILNEN